MKIWRAGPEDSDGWATMRHALWPEADVETHAAEIAEYFRDVKRVGFLASGDDGQWLGFAEAGLRHDYVNGCETSPVAFLEGIYVAPDARGQGVARALIASVENWARQTGCTEFASDALLENIASHAMHEALGFEETERVVYFRKLLG